MKKFLITSVLSLVASVSLFAQGLGTPVMLSTNIGGTFNLLSIGAKVKYISLTGPVAGTATFYDSSSVAALSTNGGVVYTGGVAVITPAYTGYTNFLTNTVTTNYIGLAGTTNLYTNYAGMWTVSVSVPLSTNALKPLGSFAVGGNSMASYPVDWIATRGVSVTLSTNTSVILYYLPE